MSDTGVEPNGNSIYYTIYTPSTGGPYGYLHLATDRQNIMCKRVTREWMTKFPSWRRLWVLVDAEPGPNVILSGSSNAKKLKRMHDVLVETRILPRPPQPVYMTPEENIETPPDTLIQGIRDDLARLRGKLADIARAYPEWKERVFPAEGGLTCVISLLYNSKQEIAKHRELYGHSPRWLLPLPEEET